MATEHFSLGAIFLWPFYLAFLPTVILSRTILFVGAWLGLPFCSTTPAEAAPPPPRAAAGAAPPRAPPRGRGSARAHDGGGDHDGVPSPVRRWWQTAPSSEASSICGSRARASSAAFAPPPLRGRGRGDKCAAAMTGDEDEDGGGPFGFLDDLEDASCGSGDGCGNDYEWAGASAFDDTCWDGSPAAPPRAAARGAPHGHAVHGRRGAGGAGGGARRAPAGAAGARGAGGTRGHHLHGTHHAHARAPPAPAPGPGGPPPAAALAAAFSRLRARASSLRAAQDALRAARGALRAERRRADEAAHRRDAAATQQRLELIYLRRTLDARSAEVAMRLDALDGAWRGLMEDEEEAAARTAEVAAEAAAARAALEAVEAHEARVARREAAARAARAAVAALAARAAAAAAASGGGAGTAAGIGGLPPGIDFGALAEEEADRILAALGAAPMPPHGSDAGSDAGAGAAAAEASGVVWVSRSPRLRQATGKRGAGAAAAAAREQQQQQQHEKAPWLGPRDSWEGPEPEFKSHPNSKPQPAFKPQPAARGRYEPECEPPLAPPLPPSAARRPRMASDGPAHAHAHAAALQWQDARASWQSCNSGGFDDVVAASGNACGKDDARGARCNDDDCGAEAGGSDTDDSFLDARCESATPRAAAAAAAAAAGRPPRPPSAPGDRPLFAAAAAGAPPPGRGIGRSGGGAHRVALGVDVGAAQLPPFLGDTKWWPPSPLSKVEADAGQPRAEVGAQGP